ncbi:MAG TPA: hypothetical protein VG755_05065 [Nannocystaceae bacterium]|nr:hypothetical protein [Nannocystaceae bacterium]
MAVNPYAAPSSDETSHARDVGETSRGAIALARGWLVLVLLGLAAGGASAFALRIEAWTPDLDGTVEAAGRWFALHRAAMTTGVGIPALYGLSTTLVATERLRSARLLPLAAIALLVVGGGVVVVVGTASSDDGWTHFDPHPSPTAWIGPALLTCGLALQTVYLLAQSIASSAATRARRLVVLLVTVAIAARTTFVATGIDPTPVDAALAAVIVAWALVRDGAAWWRSPALVLLAFGIVPATIGIRIARRILDRVGDIHLHDTTFISGSDHLWSTALGLAVLAGILASSVELFGRRVHAWLARIAAVLLSVGMLGHAIALMVLGARGMPLGYVAYPEIFVGPQRAASAATAIIAIGALVLLLALVLGKRAELLAGRGRPPLLG